MLRPKYPGEDREYRSSRSQPFPPQVDPHSEANSRTCNTYKIGGGA